MKDETIHTWHAHGRAIYQLRTEKSGVLCGHMCSNAAKLHILRNSIARITHHKGHVCRKNEKQRVKAEEDGLRVEHGYMAV